MSNLCEQVNSIIGVNQLFEEKKLKLNNYYNIYTDFKYPLDDNNFREQALTCDLMRLDEIIIDRNDEINNVFKFMLLSKKKIQNSFLKKTYTNYIVEISKNNFELEITPDICSSKLWIISYE